MLLIFHVEKSRLQPGLGRGPLGGSGEAEQVPGRLLHVHGVLLGAGGHHGAVWGVFSSRFGANLV